MKLTIRQLQVFDAVATLGSVTKAAEKLNMSQSAASMALTDIQIVLGRSLFAHSRGRKLEITDEGRRLIPLVKAIIGRLEDLGRPGADVQPSGNLVIGASPLIAETILPRLCVDFMQIYPAVRIQVEVETARNLIDRLTRFELETALIEILPKIEGVELTPWRTDELVLVVAAGHPLARREPLRIKDLAGYAWCTREAQSSTAAHLRYMLNPKIGDFDVAFQATSNWAVRHAVIAGGGIGCLSKALVQFDIDNGRLVQLDVADFQYTRPLSLARPINIWRGQLTSAFDAFLLQQGNVNS
jgi:DNA-binding transcriptional LysR family regulator